MCLVGAWEPCAHFVLSWTSAFVCSVNVTLGGAPLCSTQPEQPHRVALMSCLALGKLTSQSLSLFCKIGVVRTGPQSAIPTRVGSGISH